ncbi:hypothetical protein LAZ67_8002310 [Cordylochernes scorpioides]|uniref:CCHC-type domain-containing protein n=1 Tax=Cordylochernes scorpioides TaxID=51811 RepID=A0ABY6KQU8_9ARAC|nr:hypothetical protein LAZ67_8002310 [Cordylochernes scorpioides]
MNKDEKEAQEQEIGEFPNNDHGPTTPPPHLGTIILQLATILEGLQPLHPRDLDLTSFDVFSLPSLAITSSAQSQQSPEVLNSSRNHPFQGSVDPEHGSGYRPLNFLYPQGLGDMLEMTSMDPEWKDKMFTGDETWFNGYDPETKRQSAEWRGQAKVSKTFSEALNQTVPLPIPKPIPQLDLASTTEPEPQEPKDSQMKKRTLEASLNEEKSPTSSQQDDELKRKEPAPAGVASPPRRIRSDADREDWLLDLFKDLNYQTILSPILQSTDEDSYDSAVVSLATNDHATQLITNGFKVGDTTIYPTPLVTAERKYILSGVMAFIQDEDIIKALEPYGKTLFIRPIPFPTENPLFKHLSSLRREIIFKLKENHVMPANIIINYMENSFRVFIGEDIICAGCRRHGHIKRQCPFDPAIAFKVSKTFSEALNQTVPSPTPKPIPQLDLTPTTEPGPQEPKDSQIKKRTLEASLNEEKSPNVENIGGKRPKPSSTGQKPDTDSYGPPSLTSTTTSSQQDDDLVGKEPAPAGVASPPQRRVCMRHEDRENWLKDLFKELNHETILSPILRRTDVNSIITSILWPGTRKEFLDAPPNHKIILADFFGTVLERAQGGDRATLDKLTDYKKALM